jgi:AraC-like DNA-binding protein
MKAFGNAGCIRQFARFTREQGIPFDSMLDDELRAVLVASETTDHVPAHAIVDMLQICSIYTNRSDLGASVAAWANVSGGFGPLSLVWEYSPNLAEAIRVNRRYIHLENAAVSFEVSEERDGLALQHLLMVPARFGGSQFIEASLTLDLRIIRMILGDSNWSPVRLELAHPAPSSARTQHALFRCPIEFGADRNAILVRRSDLERPAQNGNAQMFTYLEDHIWRTNAAIPDDLPRQVYGLITAKLVSGQATLEHIAHDLAMSPRALQRHLALHNLAFTTILMEVRKRVAEEYFRCEKRPNLTQLAHRLGFSDDSSTSRYLRKYLGTGARSLQRRKHLDDGRQSTITDGINALAVHRENNIRAA